MRYLAQSKPVKFRLKVGETECRSIEDVRRTSDFPSLWDNYEDGKEDGKLKKWLSQINQSGYLDEVDKIKDKTKKRLILYNKFTNAPISDNDYIQMFDKGIITPDVFNEKCAKDQKLLNKYFETKHSVEHLDDTNINSLVNKLLDNDSIIELINQSSIDKSTLNNLCVNNDDLLDWCFKNKQDLLSDENIRKLIDNNRITDEELIIRISKKRKLDDILARFHKIPINVGSVSFYMIRVNKNFYIGEFPVTNELWETLMPSKEYGDSSQVATYPVSMVSWNDCQNFIAKLNEYTHRKFRLPRQDEWKYAARGGDKSHNYRYAGSNDIDEVAWYNNNSGQCRHPVGRKKPNELDLYDMTGNVWEWCSDDFKGRKLLLGGSFSAFPDSCRLDAQDDDYPVNYSIRYGFRLAMDLE